MDKRPLIIAAILFLLVTGSWLLLDSSDTKKRARPTQAPDFFVEGLTARTFNTLGNLRYQLAAETMTHNPNDGSTTLTSPVINFFDAKKPSWHITAQQGWVSADGEKVVLSGAVNANRQASKTNTPIHIVAEDFHIEPNKGYIETDNKVELSSLNNRAEAVGMQAWFDKPAKIKLLSKARGYYEVH